jgi:CRISPR system Cascade subunit CasC
MPSTVIDVHILQTVPPSNLNRDDTGSPKAAVYGGVRRARVSSQAWKRATRKAFNATLDTGELGIRTKHLVQVLADRIRDTAPDISTDDAVTAATRTLGVAIKLEKPRAKSNAAKDAPDEPDQSGYLFFVSSRQLDRLAEMAIRLATAGAAPTKKDVLDTLRAQQSIDISLFGRMVADAPEINVDAAAQVAHAISVHAVDNEFDYFTAVDDRAPDDNAGAGMIGTVEFNSSTLYRYATVDVQHLRENLDGAGDLDAATSRAVQAFVRAIITSMPTGKQNTFANRTLPDAVLVQVRHGQPVNLVGAFEDPVVADDGTGTGRLRRAVQRLVDYAASTDLTFGTHPDTAYVVHRGGTTTDPLDQLGQRVTLDQLIQALDQVARRTAPVPA